MRINPDNAVLNLFNKVFDVLYTTLLFLICCVPVVTAGASFTAMYSTMLSLVRDSCSGVTAKFFSAFKENFAIATKIWCVILPAGVILFLDIFACWGYAEESTVFLYCIKGFTIFALVMYLSITAYAFSGLAAYHVTFRQAMNNAFIWTLAHPLLSLAVVGLALLMIAACIMTWFYAFFVIAPAFYYQSSIILRSILPEEAEKLKKQPENQETYYYE